MSILHTILAPFIALTSLFSASPLTRMVDRVQSSVVRVTGERETFHYICSGEVIAPARVLTAAHCLGGSMLADGQTVRVLKVDEYYDLALLETITTKPRLAFRDVPVQRLETMV